MVLCHELNKDSYQHYHQSRSVFSTSKKQFFSNTVKTCQVVNILTLTNSSFYQVCDLNDMLELGL